MNRKGRERERNEVRKRKRKRVERAREGAGEGGEREIEIGGGCIITRKLVERGPREESTRCGDVCLQKG